MPEFWTSRAWTDSHSDFFIRNIWAFSPGWESAEAAATASFTPNNVRPTWPTLDEVTRWAESINNYPGAGAGSRVNLENLQLALDAAVELVSMLIHEQVRPVDSAGEVDPGGTPVEIPATAKLATIMQATRWARRAMSPDGVLGTSDISGVIRAQAMDPDIERMLFAWSYVGLY